MCGVIAIHSTTATEKIPYEVFEGLMALQHRGQDSVGIANDSCTVKRAGLVKYAFKNDDLSKLKGQMCIGHVRYATNGVSNNIQPLYSLLPVRTTLCHNGNITNIEEIKQLLKTKYMVSVHTNSDSELILILFNVKLHELLRNEYTIQPETINIISEYLHNTLIGSFCLLITIQDYGLIVIRDSRGIRPLIWGQNGNKNIIASESVSLNLLNYTVVRDVLPGETIIFDNQRENPIHFYRENILLEPCLFEYIYFARPDSSIENISVHQARIIIGNLMGEKIQNKWDSSQIDVIVPVPDTSITFANGIQDVIHKPIREGFIKNRYIDRTFIMENNNMIQRNIKRKLTGIETVFAGKNVLIVDDSIVRGNTCRHIIEIARNYGAKTIYFASCAPIIKSTNIYGIHIPTKKELISFESTEDDIRNKIEVDYLIYNDLDTITNELKKLNPNIHQFEISMFL